jgi:hypothetical protein
VPEFIFLMNKAGPSKSDVKRGNIDRRLLMDEKRLIVSKSLRTVLPALLRKETLPLNGSEVNLIADHLAK